MFGGYILQKIKFNYFKEQLVKTDDLFILNTSLMDIQSLIKIKSHLLCYGIKSNKYAQEFYATQNPHDIKKSGYVGLHFILDKKLVVLASTTNTFDSLSDYEILKDGESFYFSSKKNEPIPISPIIMPDWHAKKLKDNKPTTKYFVHEGTNYLHQLYSGCIFQAKNKGCKFCETGKDFVSNNPEDIAETALLACKNNNQYHICLGGGVRNKKTGGTDFFLKIVKKIRTKNKVNPIWIEMIPPENNEHLQELINAGVNGFGLNLEIWDDKLRKKICPEKSLISKERYFSAWEYIQEKSGLGAVNTALIAGLESTKSTKEGISQISKKRVRITLLPFKPWDGCKLNKSKPVNNKVYYDLAYYLASSMKKYGINSKDNFGCANCSSCTLEDDILKYLL